MLSMVGLSEAPKGVERKSAGKSIEYCQSAPGTLIENTLTSYPGRYMLPSQKPNYIICEGIAIEICQYSLNLLLIARGPTYLANDTAILCKFLSQRMREAAHLISSIMLSDLG
jgi:hypothetical protein